MYLLVETWYYLLGATSVVNENLLWKHFIYFPPKKQEMWNRFVLIMELFKQKIFSRLEPRQKVVKQLLVAQNCTQFNILMNFPKKQTKHCLMISIKCNKSLHDFGEFRKKILPRKMVADAVAMLTSKDKQEQSEGNDALLFNN